MRQSRNYTFRFELPASIERAFELFSDPNLLDGLTPGWFELRPIGDVPDPLSVGSVISYRLRWRGLPLRWTSRIVEWDPPRALTYEQARGPYLSFRHDHRFRTVSGGTEVVDRVTYRAYGGWLADRLIVRRDLERIFRHRAQSARRLLGRPAPKLSPADRYGSSGLVSRAGRAGL